MANILPLYLNKYVQHNTTQFVHLTFNNHSTSEDCYEALIEHLHNRLSCLVLHHQHKGIPREMTSHHKDVFHHGGLIQFHHEHYAGVIEMHKLQRGIRSNQTDGSPWHFPLKHLAAWASPHYSLAILHQGPLLTLMASISVYPIKCHVALSHRDDEG